MDRRPARRSNYRERALIRGPAISSLSPPPEPGTERLPVQSVLDARAPEHPGGERVAVRPGPVTVALRMGIGLIQNCHDTSRGVSFPFHGDARCAAADAVL